MQAEKALEYYTGSAEPPAMISCILLGLLGDPHLMLGMLCTAFDCQ
jgi:hypothetical protein